MEFGFAESGTGVVDFVLKAVEVERKQYIAPPLLILPVLGWSCQSYCFLFITASFTCSIRLLHNPMPAGTFYHCLGAHWALKKVDYDIYCPLDNSLIIFASIYSCHLSNILSNIQLARRQTPVREGQAGERCMYGSLNWLYRIICDRVFAHRRSVETPDFLTGNS